jgi:hypothetical protein
LGRLFNDKQWKVIRKSAIRFRFRCAARWNRRFRQNIGPNVGHFMTLKNIFRLKFFVEPLNSGVPEPYNSHPNPPWFGLHWPLFLASVVSCAVSCMVLCLLLAVFPNFKSSSLRSSDLKPGKPAIGK